MPDTFKGALIYCSRAKERLKLWGITKSRSASKSNHQRTNRQRGRLYQSDDGQIRLDVRLEDETIWLTINQMAGLFGVDKSGISRHLKNIFETGELQRQAIVAKFATVQNEGGRSVSRNLEYYNLDAIISVGYRVNSIRPSAESTKIFSAECKTKCTGQLTATLPLS